MKKPRPENTRLRTDDEGNLILTGAFMKSHSLEVGDEYAAWKEGESIILAFKKIYRGRRRIPKHAHRGRIEQVSPDVPMRKGKKLRKKRVMR